MHKRLNDTPTIRWLGSLDIPGDGKWRRFIAYTVSMKPEINYPFGGHIVFTSDTLWSIVKECSIFESCQGNVGICLVDTNNLEKGGIIFGEKF